MSDNATALSSPSSDTAQRRIRAVAYDPRHGFDRDVPLKRISDLLAQYSTLVWLDLENPAPKDLRMLREEFEAHPLALEEATSIHHRPKCSEYPGLYVLIMNVPGPAAGGEISLRQVSILIGRSFLVTVHSDPFPEIDDCLRRWQNNPEVQTGSIAVPLYALLDTIVDAYFPVVDDLAERIEKVQDRIVEGIGESDTPGRDIFELKNELLALRRVVSGQRDSLNVFLRQDVPIFPEASLPYFQSVFDHLVRLVESIDLYRDIMASALEMHLAVVSNRLNQVMKTLTVFSIILMSSSLITGIYGMNFKNMPELNTRYGYFVVLGVIAVMSAGLLAYFRRIKWL